MPDDEPRAALSAPRPLRAGPVHALLDGIDLREISLGGRPLIDHIYVAVRAHDWSTVPAQVADLDLQADEQTFEVSFAARHRDGALDFEWRGRAEGTADGRIRYSLVGETLADFDYCRIGICVLHPDHLAGAAYRARTAEGEVAGELPRLIAPQLLRDGGVVPPVPVYHRLAVTAHTGETVIVRSDCDLFELEDQRNWTDASFKSYMPPIRPGYPYPAKRGQQFEQRVEVEIDGPAMPGLRREATDQVGITLGADTGAVLPPVGFGCPTDGRGLSPAERSLLAPLQPDHLRVELWFGAPGWRELLEEAITMARQLGCPLEPALFVGVDDSEALERSVVRLADVEVARWAVFDSSAAYTSSTSPEAVALVRSVLDARRPGAMLVAGSASDFVQLNRARTTFEGVDALTWGISPTVHSSDGRSVLENAWAQGITVETARSFAAGRLLCVGPVELSRRSEAADHRQGSLLAAAWTVASLADLVSTRADAITYGELAGPRGLLQRASEGTRSEPLARPVHAVFAQLASMRGGGVLEWESSAGRDVAILAVTHGDSAPSGMLANLTARRLRVSVDSPQEPLAASLEPHAVVGFQTGRRWHPDASRLWPLTQGSAGVHRAPAPEDR